MRFFVTGATGFIGGAFCQAAVARGHEILALTRRNHERLPPGSRPVLGSLREPPWQEIEHFEPDAVLHAAWIATPGQYLTAPENTALADDSRALFRGLATMGVPHLCGLGTCIEYGPSAAPLEEIGSSIEPAFPYSIAKAALADQLFALGNEFGPITSWFRVFFPYGPGEHPGRLPSHAIKALAAGKAVSLSHPDSVRDYVYIADVAAALCHALEVRLGGPVNVGSGTGIAVRDLVLRIADLLGADASLIERAADATTDPMPTIVADTSKLRATGWSPTVSLQDGLERLIRSCS